jgi:NADH:ubiquinone oxidoreductase subunit F (NADH-binding)
MLPIPVFRDRSSSDSFYHLAASGILGTLCRGMACFVARHQDPQRWQAALAQQPGVYCLGKCYAGPAAASDELRPVIEVHAPRCIVLERVAQGGCRALSDYRKGGGYRSLEAVLRQPPEAIIRGIEASGLRGRGGAGFPTGRKWRAVFTQKSLEKFIVANADEGDPGAYIDRFILEDDPHALIEGMLIAAYAVGATKGFIYLRCEYPRAGLILQHALDEARREGLFGPRVLGSSFTFDVEIVTGKGSYICGEETALLNSIEGRRPEVRIRPPYPADSGLFGKPTLVNNVETLANVAWIVGNGAEAYRALGFSNSRGTKVVSLNSLFRRPGLYEIEFGIPVRKIVEDLGGGLKTGAIHGLIIGGPLAGVIPPELFDTPFGFEELQAIGAAVGHGGIIAFDERTSIAELVHHVFQFGAFESCGKCTPCRLGNPRVEQIFSSVLKNGAAAVAEEKEFREIVSALSLASLCGLGGGVGEFAESILRHYPKEVAACFK